MMMGESYGIGSRKVMPDSILFSVQNFGYVFLNVIFVIVKLLEGVCCLLCGLKHILNLSMRIIEV